MKVKEEKRTTEGFKKKKEYIKKYLKEQSHPIALRFSEKNDKDIVAHLNKQKNKSQYIKDLIRADMNKGK